MRITSKGQVTIPQEIREKAGLFPHTEVEFDFDGKTVRIRRAQAGKGRRKAPSRGEKLVAQLRGRAGKGMSTDEILALTRGE
jgi:AbrB family looped-hinge helix DNA binding protein